MKYEQCRALYRYTAGEAEPILYGRGQWLHSRSGKRYLDMSSSACYASLGHSNQYVINAIYEQLNRVPSIFSGFWPSDAAEQAATTIADLFDQANPGWIGKAIFQGSGSEAVDLACKLAAQFRAEIGETRPTKIVSRNHSYHGALLLPTSLSGSYPRYELNTSYHYPVGKDYVIKLPHPFDLSSEDALRSLEELNYHAFTNNLAAVIIEPIGGPPVGALPDRLYYLQKLRKLCDELNILLIYDEILCGSGRCGYLSVAGCYKVWPDIVLLGKGITSGYQPVSVICCSQKVIDRISKGSGQLMFGTCFSAHTTGCAAVTATLNYIHANDLFRRVRDNNLYWILKNELMESCPIVKSVTGMGYLYGLRLQDPETKEAFHPKEAFHALARRCILEQGAVVYSKGQTVWGKEDFIIVAPPFEIDESLIDLGCSMIKKGLEVAYKTYLITDQPP